MAARPGALVCTAFTAPPADNMSTDWDSRCGFADAVEAMRERKVEDRQALALLGATPVHLPFCDSQYRSSPSREELGAAIQRVIDDVKPATLAIPMGLFHSDHTLVSNACLALLPRLGDPIVLLYEDVPYRGIAGVAQTRLASLLRYGYVLEAVDTLPEMDPLPQQMKNAAIEAYASQLRAFGPDGLAGLHTPERQWRLCSAAGAGVPEEPRE